MICIVHKYNKRTRYSKMLGKVFGESFDELALSLGSTVRPVRVVDGWAFLPDEISLERVGDSGWPETHGYNTRAE